MSNSSRALRQVVSVDGWIAAFDEQDTATVHADVVFREGRFGADSADQVRFKLKLSRAEIVLIVPEGEPLRVMRRTIQRTPSSPAETRSVTRETSAELGGNARFDLSATSVPAAAVGGGAAASGRTSTRQELTEMVSGVVEQHFSTLEGHPAWEVQTIGCGWLQGNPWEAEDAPRLSVKRLSERNRDGDKPTLRIEIRCRREDFEITDLELKDSEKQGWFAKRKNRDINLAAAEQVIKEELLSAGFLRAPDLSEQHSEMLIADVIISEDW
jgi:hypothetical protein